MKYTFLWGILVASIILSGCFHRNEAPAVTQPTPDVQQPTSDTQTDTGEQVDTGTTLPTDSWEVADINGTGSTDTGFKTKDFSDPEVEEVIDLLQDMIKK